MTPVLAVVATMIAGAVMFALLGKNPADVIRTIFWAPLFDENLASYARPQILVKAAPLILIAVGLSLGFRAGIWNIGAEGQYIMGAIAGGGTALAFYPLDAWWIFPLMIAAGMLGGILWAMISAILKVRFNTNEILVSLMLVYVAEQALAAVSLGPLRNPEGTGFPGSRNLQYYESAANSELVPGTGLHLGVIFAALTVIAAYVLFRQHKLGFQIRLTGESIRAARMSGVKPGLLAIFCLSTGGALAGLAGIFELSGPAGQLNIDFNVGYGFTAIIVAFLGRLNPVGITLAGLLMALTYIGGELAQFMIGLPAAAIQAFQECFCFSFSQWTFCQDTALQCGLSRPPDMDFSAINPLTLVAIMVAASVPVMAASIGELVAERSGVLNLGVEGMMITGAACGFIAAVETGSPVVGVFAGIASGAALSIIFGSLTQFLHSNQVATGLALTLFGLGFSAMLGQTYSGIKPPSFPRPEFGMLADIPILGAIVFSYDYLVYATFLVVLGVWCYFRFTRSGLVLRAIGENHDAAHALGYRVVRARLLAIMFGGACAGLGGVYLSLIRVPQWTEGLTAGAGWIALALVVFASWRPLRIILGAFLFGGVTLLQLNLQAVGVEINAAYLSMSPYLVTILALMVMSRTKLRGVNVAPASLGRPFYPSA